MSQITVTKNIVDAIERQIANLDKAESGAGEAQLTMLDKVAEIGAKHGLDRDHAKLAAHKAFKNHYAGKPDNTWMPKASTAINAIVAGPRWPAAKKVALAAHGKDYTAGRRKYALVQIAAKLAANSDKPLSAGAFKSELSRMEQRKADKAKDYDAALKRVNAALDHLAEIGAGGVDKVREAIAASVSPPEGYTPKAPKGQKVESAQEVETETETGVPSLDDLMGDLTAMAAMLQNPQVKKMLAGAKPRQKRGRKAA